ncbi:uncharacterized protein F5Z01DRAFT_245365 [Emericellopsis atlantica]|uniref:Rhodopsin domain-containing protein n=1 Tax=Emericellopsis atlantica TaxID=2614577 RepID=A0A9P8CNS1_9HYPO|nr:uncharacterized protein F5Z01DRAFT_245365 [Emericellopsis atlantica]KAG9252016.1 hypothetical protein F5Z01DRAFT_245365 [Emericellopsis atlantica]
MSSVTQFVSEIWSLFAVGVAVTLVRIYARTKVVGFKGLQPDDYLASIALLGFAGMAGIAFVGGSMYHKEMAGGMLPEQRPGEKPSAEALAIRVKGNKLHFAQWVVYATTLWTLKSSLLVLYMRLTTGLAGRFACRIKAGFIMVAATWVAVMLTIFLSCRPFTDYFKPNVNGSAVCRAAISPPIVWTCYALNVFTDLYLITLPMPLLWKTSMKTYKKVGLGLLFSAGAVIIVFATIRCVLIYIDPKDGAPVSGTWAVRETFVAVITTNFPTSFSLVKTMLGSTLKSLRSTQHTEQEGKKPSELRTFGSSTRASKKIRGVGDPTATNMLFSASEEQIVNGGMPTPMEEGRWSDPTLGSDGAQDEETVDRVNTPKIG